MYKALYLSPMIPSYNLVETVLFFTDVLEFKIARDDKNYFYTIQGRSDDPYSQRGK